MGGVTPVGRGSRAAAALATDALRTVLRPLGPLLQEVHDAVRAAPNPPHEINVQFGVQVGQDLKLGIVGANGQASLTVSATWQLSEEMGTGRAARTAVPVPARVPAPVPVPAPPPEPWGGSTPTGPPHGPRYPSWPGPTASPPAPPYCCPDSTC
ncbi:CU044_2847 family protein [Streptomyces sp. FXJ1.4098]|nr:CU044_2847 family protein [Streptomyces sp. FXJ1.4098]